MNSMNSFRFVNDEKKTDNETVVLKTNVLENDAHL